MRSGGVLGGPGLGGAIGGDERPHRHRQGSEGVDGARGAKAFVSEEDATGLEKQKNMAEAKQEMKIGDEMEDGTIYAGISPDTHKPMYATPKDAPGGYDFHQAAKYAKNLDAHGHKDWRAPTKGELNVLWENRDKGKLKGTFNETGSYPAGWYWSSSQVGSLDAWGQRFSDGYQYIGIKGSDSSLRCVRG